MRIDKVEIDGFGKLNHVTLTFSSGFNLILGDNESGKSTLCEFLLAMFYEMPNEGKRLALSETARKKYRPWKGTDFGGRVYFTDDDGVRYVLDKKFGATKRSDRARLLYADTWDDAGSAENVGERFFRLGREGFLKTLYIKNLEADSSEDGTEILTRLSNMETSGEEDVSYSNIKNALDKAQLAILSKTGKGGRLAVLREEANALEAEKLAYLRMRERLREEELAQAEMLQKIENLAKEREALEKQCAVAAEYEAYVAGIKAKETRSMLETRYQAEEGQLFKLREMRIRLTEQEKTAVSSADLETAKTLEKRLIILESKQEEFEKQKEVLARKSAERNEKRKRMCVFITIAIFAAFALCGILLYGAMKPLGVSLPVVGLIAAAVAFLVIKKAPVLSEGDISEKNPAEETEEIRQELIGLCKTHGAETLDALYALAAEQKNAQKSAEEVTAQIAQCEAQMKALSVNLSELVLPAEKEFSKDVMTYSGESAKTLRARIAQLQREQEALKERYYALSMELAKQTAEERCLSDIESDLNAVTEEISVLEKQYEAYRQADLWLQSAHKEIKQNFAPRLNKKTAEIFCAFTRGKYRDVRVGDGFRVNYQNESGEIVEADYLSSGTYDLLYIALRLATVGVLAEGETPPLILDDAFLQFDDARLKLAAEYLVTSGGFGQILSFTCHRETANVFEKEKINLIDLNLEGVLNHGLQN